MATKALGNLTIVDDAKRLEGTRNRSYLCEKDFEALAKARGLV